MQDAAWVDRHVIFVTLCGVICGMEDWQAIEEWGQERLDWLRQYAALENGIPSHDTLVRVFAAPSGSSAAIGTSKTGCIGAWM